MNLVKLFSPRDCICCKPAYNRRSDPSQSGKFYSPMLKRWLLYVGSVLLGLAVVGGLLGAFVLALLYPTLPSLESLTDYQPKIPLRIVSAEGRPPGRIRRGAAGDRDYRRSAGCDEKGDSGRRR